MTKDEMINRIYSWVGVYVSTKTVSDGSGYTYEDFEKQQYEQAKEIIVSLSTNENVKSDHDKWLEEKNRREAGLNKT